MPRRHPALLAPALLALVAACAPARGPVAAPPTPASTPAQPAPAQPAPGAPAAARTGPAPDWQLLDPATDSVPGTGAARALGELLAGRQPARTVVVAVIDGGVDSAHVALRPVLWTNPRETADGRDDDADGLVDDVRGWNYLGGADGRSIDHERLELTRLAARCRAGAGLAGLAVQPAVTCPQLVSALDSARQVNGRQLAQIGQVAAVADSAVATLARALGTVPDSVTLARVQAMPAAGGAVGQARAQYLYLTGLGAAPAALREARQQLADRERYELNPDYDPRPLVGDTPAAGVRYGNADVTGPDASHGTHVAGIVAAVPGRSPADSGARGVAPAAAVRIMGVRAVPNGDERDKDVAAAIRYAVDHGAQIINMSFGKGYSADKAAVDSAVRYADAKGVLMVHAAGNEASDNDRTPNFPTPRYLGGGRPALWLEVGASTWRRDRLAASFSNYGAGTVDLFAPGGDIYSTLPGGTFGRNSGTSMAAPVVSGVAALLMAYFPQLTAADVKRILLETATRYPGLSVPRPGAPDARVPFASLSATGGVVNAYEAVRTAQRATAGR